VYGYYVFNTKFVVLYLLSKSLFASAGRYYSWQEYVNNTRSDKLVSLKNRGGRVVDLYEICCKTINLKN